MKLGVFYHKNRRKSPLTKGLYIIIGLLIGYVIFVSSLTYQAHSSSLQKAEIIKQKPAEFNEEHLSKSILAELAIDRRNPSMARDYYIKLAKQTKDPYIAKRAVYINLSMGSPQLATEPAKIWADNQLNDPEAQQVAANLLLYDGKIQQAMPYVDRVISNANDPPSLERFVQSLSLQSIADYNKFVNAIEKLHKKYKNNKHALFNLAILYQQLQQYPKASQVVQQVLYDHPTWVDAVILKAKLLVQESKYDAAMDFVKQQIKRYPNFPQLNILNAELLLHAEQNTEAKTILEKLVNDPKVASSAHMHLAHIAIKKKDINTARKHLIEAAKDPKISVTAYYILGELADYEKNYNDAIYWYKKVSEGPYYLSAQLKVVLILSQLDRSDEALKYLEYISPRNFEEAKQLYVIQAEILISKHKYQDALNSMNNALQVLPNNIDLLYMRGLIAQHIGRLDILEKDMKQILALDPNQANALNLLGFMLTEKTHRYEEALEYIKRALVLEPENPDILDSMGWVQYRMGHLDKALGYLQKAYGIQPDGEIAAHLGEVLWVSGKPKDAKAIWQRGLKLDPENEEILETINRLQKGTL